MKESKLTCDSVGPLASIIDAITQELAVYYSVYSQMNCSMNHKRGGINIAETSNIK